MLNDAALRRATNERETFFRLRMDTNMNVYNWLLSVARENIS